MKYYIIACEDLSGFHLWKERDDDMEDDLVDAVSAETIGFDCEDGTSDEFLGKAAEYIRNELGIEDSYDVIFD